MISKTAVRYAKLPSVFAMMVKISFRDFHDFANLNTRRSRKDRNMDKLITFSNRSSTNDNATITKSKTFQLSCIVEKLLLMEKSFASFIIYWFTICKYIIYYYKDDTYPKKELWAHRRHFDKRLNGKHGGKKIVSID